MAKLVYDSNPNFIYHYTAESRDGGTLVNGMHYDRSMVITYFLRGSGHIIVEGNNSSVNEGDLILLNPNEFHSCFFDKNPDHRRISIYIYPSLAQGLPISFDEFFGAFLSRPLGQTNVISSQNLKKTGISQLLSEIESLNTNQAPDAVMMQCKVIELVILLKKAVALEADQTDNRSDNTVITSLIEYINSHLTENLSTSHLAQAMFLDKSYLCRLFKRCTGATINEYISKKRIDLAIKLIDEGMSCTDACYKSGFGNYSSFFKYYRRYTSRIPLNDKSSQSH